MKFKDFMSQFRDVDSPMGDFAQDVTRDREYPDLEQNYPRLEQYFDYQASIRSNSELPKLFRTAWLFYHALYPEDGYDNYPEA